MSVRIYMDVHVSIGQCVRDLEFLAKVAEPADLAGQVEYLPLT